ncbi:pentatricopeptide repeat-containing protein [Striga asiatica]|uniref:Pentatricopeptide repeat-containing protein n=1 Tax=Striga asiatica TaxID=4170 RepID=A0A5A7PS88_STRAF|nr:pentatricopeptide repeat-containing protein [Striga asiatica]
MMSSLTSCPMNCAAPFYYIMPEANQTIETAEKMSALGALYQLHLVKAETARALIPKEFKLVEAFGYTLGGFFLANYADSPAGNFDEYSILGRNKYYFVLTCGPSRNCLESSYILCVSCSANLFRLMTLDFLVKSPLSQRWVFKLLRVPLVFLEDDNVMCQTQKVTALPVTRKGPFRSLLSKIGMDDSRKNVKTCMDIHVEEMINNHKAMSLCSINLNANALVAPQKDTKRWMGPAVKLSLPSFSGRTEFFPDLLKYSCQIECRLRAVQPAQVVGPLHVDDESTSETDIKRNHAISVMLSKPILALEFDCLNMKVDAPTVVPQ